MYNKYNCVVCDKCEGKITQFPATNRLRRTSELSWQVSLNIPLIQVSEKTSLPRIKIINEYQRVTAKSIKKGKQMCIKTI